MSRATDDEMIDGLMDENEQLRTENAQLQERLRQIVVLAQPLQSELASTKQPEDSPTIAPEPPSYGPREDDPGDAPPSPDGL